MNTITALIFKFIGVELRPMDILLFAYVDAVYVAIWAVIRRVMKGEKK